MMGALRRRFSTIRWKLTFSYVVVTLLITLLFEALLLVVVALIFSQFYPNIAEVIAETIAADMQEVYAAPDRTPESLGLVLRESQDLQNNGGEITFSFSSSPQTQSSTDTLSVSADETFIALLDDQGRVLTSTLQASYPLGSLLVSHEPTAAKQVVAEALRGRTASARVESVGNWDNPPVAAAPVLSDQGEVLGVVYMRFPDQGIREFATGIPMVLLVSAIPLLVVSGIFGLIFGFFAGHGFSRRIKRLADASAGLAAGDLSRRVDDSSADEIGQLARQFNSMAEQLADNMRSLRLLAEQNAQLAEQAAQLATVEERSRLARELHDSVSQELFSLTMLAAAAKRQLATKPDAAATQLDDIQATAQQALQETRSLIFALRPAMLGDRGLVPALRDLVAVARERQGLDVDLAISGERRLPLEHEQALFRIVQEALANVVRHSGARAAEVTLRYEDAQVHLLIRDHGRGFDQSVPRSARSVGLDSMAERAAALGGTCSVASLPGQGTTISVTLRAPLVT